MSRNDDAASGILLLTIGFVSLITGCLPMLLLSVVFSSFVRGGVNVIGENRIRASNMSRDEKRKARRKVQTISDMGALGSFLVVGS